MITRLSSLIVILAALSGVAAAQPVVSAFNFAPPTIDTGSASANVSVTFTITDATANASYFEMSFVDPSGAQVLRGIKNLTPAPSVSDSVSVTFPRFSAAGTWKVLAVFAADTAGNTTLLDTAGLAANGFHTDLVVTSVVDAVPPGVSAFSFTPTTIDTSVADKTVTVNFTATDDRSVGSFFAGFVSPSGQTTRGTRVNAPGDFLPGPSVTSSLAIVFPKLSEAGVWKLSFINIVDSAGNTNFIDAPTAAGMGFPTDLTVVSTPDTAAPTLTAFDFNPKTISSGGATVNVTFTVTDPGSNPSGVTDFEIAFFSPTGAQAFGKALSFPATGSFSGAVSVVFPPGVEQGSWTAASILIADAAGNTLSLAQAISFTVTPPGADTTPPVITPTVSPLPNGAGWNNTLPVNVTWDVSDPESGISSKSGCDPTSLTAPTTGTTLTCFATNGATPPLSNSGSVTLKIDTTPPITSNVLATPNPVIVNTDVTITATITDAGGSAIAGAEFQVDGGPFDDLAAADGAFDSNLENVTLTLPATATPLLQTTGVHTICVRGSDFADNVGATQCVLFAVYDPNGGFATGGGGANSPTGADSAHPTGSGPVTFAFNPKYLPNNSTVPAGDLEFHYDTGNIDFKSTSWDFLVVTAGTHAQAQGSGKINNTNVCKFFLDAWDSSFQPGNVNAVGLRIYNCDGATGDRYNLPTTPATRGNIVVHP